jgi:hypothetical protein
MPLDLTRGPGVGVDPELQVHMDEVASARSARSSGKLTIWYRSMATHSPGPQVLRSIQDFAQRINRMIANSG